MAEEKQLEGADLDFDDLGIDVDDLYDENGNYTGDADFSQGDDPVGGDGEFDFGLDEDDVKVFEQIGKKEKKS